MKTAEDTGINTIKRKTDNEPVNAQANMKDLIQKAMNQNFVPVIDDWGSFIGIITRRDIIEYCYKNSELSEIEVLKKAN